MATIKWSESPASRGTVLTTQLNALANAAFSAVGSEVDNTGNLDRWAWAEYILASLDPAVGATLSLYLVHAPGGTNYGDAASANNPASDQLVDVVSVDVTSSAKRLTSQRPFLIPPGKFKFVLRNSTGVSLGGTLNTVTLYTSNEAVN